MDHELLRLAVVSTPRTGNCWVRHMLAQLLELQEIIVHLPEEVDWSHLPPRAILQLHWMPEPPFTSLVEQHGFRVVVLTRHPLDVLISILVFSQHDDSTLRWLAGAGGDERVIQGAAPLSEAFAAYAVGPRARQLLSVSTRWWHWPGAIRGRYEDIVGDTRGELERILRELNASPRKLPAEVAAQSTPNDMRSLNVHMLYHVWQAQAGLWRRFLPAEEARRIAAAHAEVLNCFGYSCDPDESLDFVTAQQAWDRFEVAGLKKTIHGLKHTVCQLQSSYHHGFGQLRQEDANQGGEIARQGGELARQAAEIELLKQRLAQVPWDRLRQIESLGPWSLGAARQLNSASGRFPRLAATVKSTLRAGRAAMTRLRRTRASR